MAGIAALLAWTALSYLWAPQGARAQDDAERLLVYTAYFVAAFGLLGRAQVRRWVEPAVVAGAFVVVVYGLSARPAAHAGGARSTARRPKGAWSSR